MRRLEIAFLGTAVEFSGPGTRERHAEACGVPPLFNVTTRRWRTSESRGQALLALCMQQGYEVTVLEGVGA